MMEPVLAPSLAAVVNENGLDAEGLRLTFEAPDSSPLNAPTRLADRSALRVSDRTKQGVWHVSSLRALWRGDRHVSSFSGEPPAEYQPPMMALENDVHILAHHFGPPTDDDILNAFSALRRRPDGRSDGLWHDLLYQCAALCLGRWTLGESEYQAIMQRLERSVRLHRESAGSRNYIGMLHDMFHRH